MGVFPQYFGRIARWIDGNEEYLQILAAGFFNQAGKVRQGGGADIRAMGIAKIERDHFAAIAFARNRQAILCAGEMKAQTGGAAGNIRHVERRWPSATRKG